MNLKKNLGRIATAFVATAMLASLTAVPASATSYDASTGIAFNKTINMTNASGATVPTATYEYNIEPGTYVAAGENTPEIKAGPSGATITEKLSFDANTSIDTDTKKATQSVKVDLSKVTFEDPGIYRYVITETDPTGVAGLETSKDDDTLYLDVYVELDNGVPTIKNYQMSTSIDAPTISGTDATYTSKFGGEDEDAYTTYTLTVIKEVSGTMADKDREYEFTINFTGLADGAKVTYGDTQSAAAASAATSVSTTLNPGEKESNGDRVVISGIPSNAKYTIAETLGEGEGYTVKVGDTTLNYANGKYTTTEATQGEENDTVTVVNERNAVSPTGIVMDIAPYALLVVVAAAGCFVFLRKRRED